MTEIERFSYNTERLKTLNHFVRSFVPGIGESIRIGSQTTNCQVPDNVKQAANRALISAFNQIERICNQDLYGEDNDESCDIDDNDDPDDESDL